MRRASEWVLAAVVLTVACGCGVLPTYTQPPAGSYTTGTRQLTVGEAAIPVQGAVVTLDFFRAAGAQPLLGRFFIEPDHSSSARVVVLSHDVWAERFASAPTIIGRNVELDGRQTVVVGVAPPAFRIPEGTVLWTPKETGARP